MFQKTLLLNQRRVATSRALFLLVGAVSFIFAAFGAVAQEKATQPTANTPNAYYAMTFGHSDFDRVMAQYWSLGSLFRSETVVAGHPIVTLVDKKYYYTYDALTRRGYRIKRSSSSVAKDKERIRPFALDLYELWAAGGEKIREESLNGVLAEVYRVTDNQGKRTLWVTQNSLKFPLRLETYSRGTNRKSELDWVQWIPDLSVEEEFFEPPGNLDLKRFDSYADFAEALKSSPVEPAPPLFYYLLHQSE